MNVNGCHDGKQVADEKDYFLREFMGDYESMAPLGTVFEISLMTFLDGVVVELMHRLGLRNE